MGRIAIITAVALVLFAKTSHAESEPKSENVALGLSLGGTAASWGMLLVGFPVLDDSLDAPSEVIVPLVYASFAGILLAPSLGHWYAGKFFTRGLGARLLGVGTFMVGVGMAFSGGDHDGNVDNDEGNQGLGAALGLAGLGLFAYGTLHDLWTAPRTAREHNARFQIVPLARPNGGGLALSGRF
jgi:hypothetical protein